MKKYKISKDWKECWIITGICIVVAIVGWYANDVHMAAYGSAGAILIPGYKWHYS